MGVFFIGLGRKSTLSVFSPYLLANRSEFLYTSIQMYDVQEKKGKT
jgi:hypothetical protein